MKRIVPLFAVSVLLCACESEDKDIYSRQIQIDSNPAGTTIVIDGLRLGKTPMSVGVETNDAGCFVRKTVVTAIPFDTGLHTQVVTFPAFRMDDGGKSAVPEKIFFDLTKSPSEGGGVIINED